MVAEKGRLHAEGAGHIRRVQAVHFAGKTNQITSLEGSEIRADKGGQVPTVLCYGHFDVQPPEPLELWESDPFEPEIRDGYLYGRGTVDDKGQLYMLLAGARELARAGELPVNVRFCCDGEEERKPTKPRVGELIGCFGPFRERFRVDAHFELFSEDGDVLAKIEAAAEFGYGSLALG